MHGTSGDGASICENRSRRPLCLHTGPGEGAEMSLGVGWGGYKGQVCKALWAIVRTLVGGMGVY